MADGSSLKVMVLAGGPDRERAVSLQSGAAVAAALRQAGHDVLQRDIGPDDLSALDAYEQWGGQVVFPVLHGSWGEGGPLQRILEDHGLAYVGCDAAAAELCMDKFATKEVFASHGLATPAYELLSAGQRRTLQPPLVIKAVREGSSVEMAICHDESSARRARARLRRRHEQLLFEQFVGGLELTVGIFDGRALPPIQIIPATEFYSYEAKYLRDDTRYLVGAESIDLPAEVLAGVSDMAAAAAKALGVRHMCRVDFLVDEAQRPWLLEVNTIPGFTSHSLLPMAAAHAGVPMAALVDRLARMALEAGQPAQQSAH